MFPDLEHGYVWDLNSRERPADHLNISPILWILVVAHFSINVRPRLFKRLEKFGDYLLVIASVLLAVPIVYLRLSCLGL